MGMVSVPVPLAFVAVIDALLLRLGYLYPDVAWSFDSNAGKLIGRFEAETHSAEVLTKEASFQLYREKVHQDTNDIRRKIYEAI